MRKHAKLGLLFVVLASVLPWQAAPAQDFEALLNAVDRVEANLKAMIEQETEVRTAEIAELRKVVEHAPTGTVGSADKLRLTQLMLEVKALRGDVDLLKKTPTGEVVTESDLLAVIEDIEYLKSELKLLGTMTGETRQQLASIDEDGFYVPPEAKPNVVELNDRLTELSASLEQVLAGKSVAGEPNPSVKHGRIAIGGVVHEQFVSGPDETSTFISKRARLTFKGEINEYARIKIQGDLAKTPKLLDGQVTISPHPQWSFSMGQYKPPFGTDFLTSATSTPFVNRSWAAGLGTDRDVGATMSFRYKFGPDYSLKLTAGMFNGSGINTSDANNNKNFVARLEAAMFGMFTLSPNVYAGKTNEVDLFKQDLVDVGGSLTWTWRSEILEAEYIYSERGDTERNGWYVWGGHSFDIGLGFLQQLQLLARFEQYDPDASINDDRTDRLTVGTTLFNDKKYTKIQLNYQAHAEQGQSVDNNKFLVNVQVAF